MAERLARELRVDRLLPTAAARRWWGGMGLWLGVWLWAATLVAVERTSLEVNEAVALGWFPTAVATLLTSLYLQAGWYWSGIRRDWIASLGLVGAAVVWTVLQGYLGGLGNAGLAALILAAGELQAWIGRQTDGSQGGIGAIDAASKAESQPSRAFDEVRVASMGRASATGDKAMVAEPNLQATRHGAETAAGALAASGGTGENDAMASEELADAEADEASDEASDVELDAEIDIEAEEAEAEESSGRSGDWLQQMTRTRHKDPDEDSEGEGPEAREIESIERLEWFGRHVWRASEVQANLHVLFQPAFAGRPRVTAEVVEGVGQVSIAELQLHGVRLFLKRPAGMSAEPGTTVVWLEAIGHVGNGD